MNVLNYNYGDNLKKIVDCLKAVTWKDLKTISGIALKKAVNVFSAPTVEPTYKISGSITVPSRSITIDGTQYTIPAVNVDCSGLTVSTTAQWHDFKTPVQGLTISYYNGKILGASDIETEDLGD